MDKTTFKQKISDYKSRGGQFAFAFGDIHLPVVFHEALNGALDKAWGEFTPGLTQNCCHTVHEEGAVTHSF